MVFGSSEVVFGLFWNILGPDFGRWTSGNFDTCCVLVGAREQRRRNPLVRKRERGVGGEGEREREREDAV